MSTHETYWEAMQAGEDTDKTFYQRRCSVCKGVGRWGQRVDLDDHSPVFMDFSCDSCEGTGYQMCRKPVQTPRVIEHLEVAWVVAVKHGEPPFSITRVQPCEERRG